MLKFFAKEPMARLTLTNVDKIEQALKIQDTAERVEKLLSLKEELAGSYKSLGRKQDMTAALAGLALITLGAVLGAATGMLYLSPVFSSVLGGVFFQSVANRSFDAKNERNSYLRDLLVKCDAELSSIYRVSPDDILNAPSVKKKRISSGELKVAFDQSAESLKFAEHDYSFVQVRSQNLLRESLKRKSHL